MATERYVVVGLAQPRSVWFRDVARWANAASIPVEFLKLLSIEQVRVSLRGGRALSALLIDDSISGLDRDLVDLALEAGCAVVLIDSGRAATSWVELGASAVLPQGFARGDLLHALGQIATPVPRPGELRGLTSVEVTPLGADTGRLVAVTGSGGTGRSTMAMALAQGLVDSRRHDLVCLADLALHADLAMLHDAGDVVPGVVELVEAHRGGTPTDDAVQDLTWHVETRGYHLLLGLRRHRDWTVIRPRAFEASIESLCRSFDVVVADVDDDLEGEQLTGSLDVEERNVMARVVTDAADLVVVVGAPGLQGLHALLRVTRDVLHHGVSGHRILPVINRSPRGHRRRAELTRAFGELLGAVASEHGVPSPVHIADRRQLELALRDTVRFPEAWAAPLCGAVQALLDRHAPELRGGREAVGLVRVEPGSLGSWPEDDEPDLSEGARR